MNLRGKGRAIAVLSIITLIGGSAVTAYAGYEIHSAAIQQSRFLLPAAQVAWAATASVKLNPPISTGEFLGTMKIPSIGKTANIFQGTETKELTEGVGHYLQSVMPGMADNSVFAGHRDTVFSNLGKVKLGADIVITTRDGTFKYKVDRIRIVDKNDRTVIVPTKVATLTLSTCYPFIYIGAAPKRYIVIATMI